MPLDEHQTNKTTHKMCVENATKIPAAAEREQTVHTFHQCTSKTVGQLQTTNYCKIMHSNCCMLS